MSRLILQKSSLCIRRWYKCMRVHTHRRRYSLSWNEGCFIIIFYVAYKTQCIALFLEEFCIYILKLRWIQIFLFNNVLFCIVKYDSYLDGENCFHYSKMQLNVGIIRCEHSEKSLKNMEAGWKGNWHYLYYRIAAVLILLHYYRGLSIL